MAGNVNLNTYKTFIQLRQNVDTDGTPGLSKAELEVFKTKAKDAGIPESLMEAMGFTRSENKARVTNFNVNEPDDSIYEESKKYFEEHGFTTEQRSSVAGSVKNISNKEYQSLMYSVYAPTMPTEPPANPNTVDLDSYKNEAMSKLKSEYQWLDKVNIYGYEITDKVDTDADLFTLYDDIVENILEKPYEDFKTENQAIIDKCKQPNFDPNTLSDEEKVVYNKLIAVKKGISNELRKAYSDIYSIAERNVKHAGQDYSEDMDLLERYEQGQVDFPEFKFYGSNTGFKIGVIQAYNEAHTNGIQDASVTKNSNSAARKLLKETVHGTKIVVIEKGDSYYDLNGRKLNSDLFSQ